MEKRIEKCDGCQHEEEPFGEECKSCRLRLLDCKMTNYVPNGVYCKDCVTYRNPVRCRRCYQFDRFTAKDNYPLSATITPDEAIRALRHGELPGTVRAAIIELIETLREGKG